MGLDIHEISASNDSLHPPLPPPFPPPLLRSTPPTAAPWTPFPHFFPLLLLCFISAFPFLPLSAYPPKKKKMLGHVSVRVDGQVHTIK